MLELKSKLTLYKTTRELLINRPRNVLLDVIAKDTGISTGWLDYCIADKLKRPGVEHVETLYIYLTGKTLNLG